MAIALLAAALAQPPDINETLQVLLPIDLAATVAGALGGALYAVRKRFTITGVLLLALPSGLGGGFLRDILLGQLPPVSLTRPVYLPASFLPALVVFFLEPVIRRIERLLFLVDTLSLGLFACVGVQKALVFHLDWPAAVLIGTLNAVGGGILRDLLSGDTPRVVLPGPPRTIAVILGCCLYVALLLLVDLRKEIAWIIVVVFTFLIRYFGVRRQWQTPTPIDLLHSRSIPPSMLSAIRRRRFTRDNRYTRHSTTSDAYRGDNDEIE